MNKIEIHKSICKKSHTTYKDKNADYGDSFAKVRREYPEAICIRLSDKLERLKVLLGGNVQHVKDESIDDTLLDMATYCIMELTERQFERQEESMLEEAEKVQKVVDEIIGEACPTCGTYNAEHFWEGKIGTCLL
jgi:hypothetical protein